MTIPENTARRGFFLVLEGIDGSGTTTQAKRLAAALEARGRAVLATCEPTDGPIGKLIRQALQKNLVDAAGAPRSFSWETMAMLFSADRLDHLHAEVLPALQAGKIVISDRYDLSTLAYQSLTSPDGAAVIPWIVELNRRAVRPDLTIVLDVDADVAAARRAARGGPPELYERADLQRRLAAVYARAEELVPGDRLVHLADGTPDAVADRILAAFSTAFGPGAAAR